MPRREAPQIQVATPEVAFEAEVAPPDQNDKRVRRTTEHASSYPKVTENTVTFAPGW